MKSSFDILSYIGAGPLRFGMSVQEVESIFGKAIRMDVNFLGEDDAQYGSFRAILKKL